MKDAKLWKRIEAAPIAAAGQPLADALKAAGLDEGTAAAVEREYRRFLYLAALVKSAPRLPSPLVARAWALHAADADAYAAFCSDLLGRDLKPRPDRTSGANARADLATRKAYAREFGAKPPAAIWPDPNRMIYWIIAGVLGAGGIAGSLAAGSVWPALIAAGLAALIIFSPKKPGQGGDDAAFHAIMGNDN